MPSEPSQILGVLLASFEELARANRELEESKRALALAHERELQREQEARVRAEEDSRRLEVLRANAEAATRARDQVLAAVSHDLRNPIGAIFASASLLLDIELPEEARRRQFELIRRSAENAERLIQDLLDVSRMEAGAFTLEPRPESAHSIAVESRDLLAGVAEARGIRLRTELEGGDVQVLADRGRILQVLSNLVGNAVKFSPAGGAVTLRVRAGRTVRFAVEDEGPGIPPEHLPHIFGRFWQGRPEGGAGLGLAIARGIVEAHGGEIHVHSSPAGSTFEFTLAAAQPATVPPTAEM